MFDTCAHNTVFVLVHRYHDRGFYLFLNSRTSVTAPVRWRKGGSDRYMSAKTVGEAGL